MYVTPKQKRKYLITSLIVAIAIPLTVLAGYMVTRYISNADEAATPENVAISNITTKSVTITWTTGVSSSGQVVVTSGGQNSDPFIDFRGVENRKTHFVEINDLDSGTDYTFRIRSNGEDYFSENGNDFKFSTFDISDNTPVPNPLYGTIQNVDDNDSIIFIYTTSPSESLPLSTTPTTTGNWIIDLSALTNSTGGLVNVTADTVLKIVIFGPDSTGDVESGKYSELVGEDGEIVDTVVLSLESKENLIAELPSGSVISSVTPVQPDPVIPDPDPVTPDPDPVTPDPDPETPDPDPVTPDPDPVVPDPEPQFDPSEREFVLRNDVTWENLILGTSTQVVPPDVVTGEGSVKFVNLTETSFGVVWLSDDAEEGEVLYGTSESDLSDKARDIRDGLLEKGSYHSHLVQVTDLDPETEYFFEISSGDDVYDDDGSPYSITTFESLSSPPPLDSISGYITGMSSFEDVVVLLTIINKDSEGTSGDSNIVGEVTDSSGNWIANIGDVRNSDGSVYYEYSDDDELEVELVVYGESDIETYVMSGISTADIVSEVIEPVSDLSGDVALLDNYGISTTFLTNLLNSNYTSPNTSVDSSMLFSILLGISVFGVSYLFKEFLDDRRSR